MSLTDLPPLDVSRPAPGARLALSLLLAINLFNYVDRQVLAAVLPDIKKTFGCSDAALGWLATAFFVSYMLLSPVFGWLADRMSRWLLVGVGVTLWSLASGASGLAISYWLLLLTRCFVGVGEAAYGPVAPTIISDLYPVARRGAVLSWFYVAIPVGSALGYWLGGRMHASSLGWRSAFYIVVAPGILLGILSFLMKDPPRGATEPGAAHHKVKRQDLLVLLRIRSYVLDTLGMTAMTFAIGGIGLWMPHYVAEYRKADSLEHANYFIGAITAGAGLIGTLLGGWAGDRLRGRFAGSYFLVSSAGLFLTMPFLLGVLFLPFPLAWVFVFLAEFCLFFNTGPSNAILANVTPPAIRASAFALNILVIHALGDVISPPIIGWISDRAGMNVAFLAVGALLVVGGILWLWGARYLAEDTAAAPGRLEGAQNNAHSDPSPERI